MADERELTLYEKRVDALLQLLPRAGGQARETFLQAQLNLKTAPDDAQYFDRWLDALASGLTADGVIDRQDLEARVATVRARLERWETAE